MSLILILLAVIAMFAWAGKAKSSTVEYCFLLASALAQLFLLFVGWGDFRNVHGGAVFLVMILFLGFATFLGELFLALKTPGRWRFLQTMGAATFSILLFVVGDTYGR